MRAAVPLRNVVRETQHGFMITIRPIESEFHLDAALRIQFTGADWRGENRRLAAIEPFHKPNETTLVAEYLLARRGMALIAQGYRKAGVEKSQFSQAPFQNCKIEFGARKRCRAGFEGNLGSGRFIRIADDAKGGFRFTVAKANEMLVPVAPNAHLHPFRKRVHDRGAHAVQPAGNFIGGLIELAAGMQPRQDQLDGGNPLFRVDIGGDSAAVIAHGKAAITIQRYPDV